MDQLGGVGRSVALNSPWDLVFHNGMLYVAMAGPHQLWQMNPKTGGITPYAGSGREALVDGPLADAALAQPSGLTTDGKKLYFADSEVSAIRMADLDPKGYVDTIVGEGLFDFGDKDGQGSEVRLQHPLGVAYHDGYVFVADTYNNKIKRIAPQKKTAETFAGTGKAGMQDGKAASFDEPGGLSIAFGKLFVADTNNHSIRTVDLQTRKVETLQIKGLERLRPRPRSVEFTGELINVAEQSIEPGSGSLVFNLELPKGYKLNDLAPTSVTLVSGKKEVVALGTAAEQTLRNVRFPATIPLNAMAGETNMRLDLLIYYCESEKESLCFFKEVRLNVPVKVRSGSGARSLSLGYALKLQATAPR
jgi:hypothetical protein